MNKLAILSLLIVGMELMAFYIQLAPKIESWTARNELVLAVQDSLDPKGLVLAQSLEKW